MSGIKDLMALSYWMDNKNFSNLDDLIKDKKKMSKQKVRILRDLNGDLNRFAKKQR